jgi:hypothetical protein
MGLIVFDQSSSVVRLAHYSMQEYLRIHLQDVERPSQGIGPDIVARTCLAVLLSTELATGPCTNVFALQRRLQSCPLLHYSASNWAYHMAMASNAVQLEWLAVRFLLDQNRVAAACQVDSRFTSTSTSWRNLNDTDKNFTGLHLATTLGCSKNVIEELLLTIDADCRTSTDETPLFLRHVSETFR